MKNGNVWIVMLSLKSNWSEIGQHSRRHHEDSFKVGIFDRGIILDCHYVYYSFFTPYIKGDAVMITQTVHCLDCDDTYDEHNWVFIPVCPHCGNTDTEQTVYLQEEEL